MQFLEKLKPLGLLILRLVLGGSFLYYGYPKLAEPARALKAFAGFGFPSYFAYIVGVLEVFGGGLIILGLLTRGIAFLLTVEMAVLVGHVLLPRVGIYAFRQYEVPLMLGAMAFALMTTGAGLISIDAFTFESSRKPAKKSKK